MRRPILFLVLLILSLLSIPNSTADEVVQSGFGTDGSPIYTSVPSGGGGPIATATNPAPIPMGGGAPPPIKVNSDGSRIEADGTYTPPPLFNPDGTRYGSNPVLSIPGATKDAPFGFTRDGVPVPPPLFNPDGTPFVLGVSPMPHPEPIIGAPFGYDSTGTPIPPPLFNPDGTPYIHGFSPMPYLPADNRQPIALVGKDEISLVNHEIMDSSIKAVKKKNGYVLDANKTISYVDTTLKIIATKKGARAKSLSLDSYSNGDLFVPTSANLKGYEIQIRRGSTVLKAVKVS
jgi:hypothetical protein